MRLQLTAVVVFVLITASLIGPRVYRSWLLHREGREVEAVVLESLPDQHRLVRYVFNANGKQFQGMDNGCAVEGGLVKVWFARDNPTVSVCDARRNWILDASFGVVAMVVGAALVWFILGAKRKVTHAHLLKKEG